ncbi:hypothetical protein IV203_032263 [Nitzschia inconspicua]|uniref:Uncharacterized protein n=1 Tax=Nitzschia inconspicua TaxID=303405 RepID=A0A9K3KJ74_9STRA|nr:hypothetical protein IV203_032263 [Nitzschia inconspicua]
MSDDTAAASCAAAAAAATTSDTIPSCMDTSSFGVQADVPVAVAVDANVLWPATSSSQDPPFMQQSVTNNNIIENASVMTVMMMDPETAVRWDTPTSPAAAVAATSAPKPSAVAFPINSNTAATSNRRSNSTDNHKVCMCSAIVAAVIFVTIVLVLLVGGKSSDYTTTPTTTVYYYDSFEAFCFVVKGFYALEQPWLDCRCDHANYWIHCQGTRPTEDSGRNDTNVVDATTTFPATNLLDDDDDDDALPLTVLRFQYDNMYGMDRTGYTGTSCECKTQSCDPDTTQCFEVSSYDYSSYCRITNNVTWGDSICTVFQVEQDWAGNEYSSFHEACQICGGLPETDSNPSKGYYHFDTSACGSDSNHDSNNNNNNNDSYCVPSLIPNRDLLYGAMTPATHTPNQQLLNSMQTSKAFCNHVTNKYENTIGGYTCTCLDEEDSDDTPEYDSEDVVNTVQCRPVNDTLNYVRWQRQYWPYGVNSMDASYSDGDNYGYSWGIAPLTYPFLLLGESCHCSEPTCTSSSVMCTALSYNFERYGCSVYDKLNAPNTTTTDDDDDVGTCGSQKCTVCELFPGDDDTGVVRVDTSSCDGQPACRPTDFFL